MRASAAQLSPPVFRRSPLNAHGVPYLIHSHWRAGSLNPPQVASAAVVPAIVVPATAVPATAPAPAQKPRHRPKQQHFANIPSTIGTHMWHRYNSFAYITIDLKYVCLRSASTGTAIKHFDTSDLSRMTPQTLGGDTNAILSSTRKKERRDRKGNSEQLYG